MTNRHLRLKTHRLSSCPRRTTIDPDAANPLLAAAVTGSKVHVGAASHSHHSGDKSMLLKDKVVVITGGAGLNGLGFATARLMVAHGARVAVLDLERADPAAAAAQLGPEHLGIVADVTDKASCDAA